MSEWSTVRKPSEQGFPHMLIGYMRASTDSDRQVLDLQRDALLSAGVDERHLFEDRVSGSRGDRAGLAKALAFLRPGDCLVVWKLDRLGRSLPHLLTTVTDLKTRGIAFRSLTEQMDTTTPQGEFQFHVFGALAQFERSLIQERVQAGLAAGRRRGRPGGRPVAIDAEKLGAVITALDGGATKAAVCRTFGIKRSTLIDSLARIGWSAGIKAKEGSPDRTGTDSLQADEAGTSGGCQGGQGCRAAPESPETVGVEFAVAGPEVIAGEIDVAPAQGREMGEDGLRHWDTVPTERVQGAAEIDGVPQHDGRGDQREPAGAMLLGFGATIAHAAEAVEAHGAGQRIARFALVQFRSGTPAQLRITEPVEHQQGALNAADFAQRQGEAILPRIGAEPTQHQGSADHARAHRSRETQQFVPAGRDQGLVDPAGDERRERRPVVRQAEGVEPALRQVRDAGREAEAEEMRQAEYVVTHATAIRMVNRGREVGLMIEQSIDDVRSFAMTGGQPGVEGHITVGDVGVDRHRRIPPGTGVDVARGLAPTGGQEQLAVRARSRAGAKDRRQGLTLMGVDHDGEGLAIGLLAQVPAGRPGEVVIAGDVAGFGHAGQAEVGGVR